MYIHCSVLIHNVRIYMNGGALHSARMHVVTTCDGKLWVQRGCNQGEESYPLAHTPLPVYNNITLVKVYYTVNNWSIIIQRNTVSVVACHSNFFEECSGAHVHASPLIYSLFRFS